MNTFDEEHIFTTFDLSRKSIQGHVNETREHSPVLVKPQPYLLYINVPLSTLLDVV